MIGKAIILPISGLWLKKKKKIQLKEFYLSVFRSRINHSMIGHVNLLLNNLLHTIASILSKKSLQINFLLHAFAFPASLYRGSKSNSESKQSSRRKFRLWVNPTALQNLPTFGLSSSKPISSEQQFLHRDAYTCLSIPKEIPFWGNMV